MTPMRDGKAWRTAAVTCTVMVAVVACSTPEPTPTVTPGPTTTRSATPTTTPTPTPTADPAVAEAENAVLTAYQSYWDRLASSTRVIVAIAASRASPDMPGGSAATCLAMRSAAGVYWR